MVKNDGLRVFQGGASQRFAAVALMVSLAAGCKLFVSGEKLWGPAFDVAVAENMAYVCAGRSLLVLDIQDPRRPAKLGQMGFSDTATGIKISGGRAVVTITGRGPVALDIFDPARIVEAAFEAAPSRTEERPGEFFAAPFTYLNDTCVFYVLRGAASLKLEPSRTPPEEAVVGRAILDPECNVRGRSALYVQPPLALVAFEHHMYEHELGVIDVSEPANPRLLGSCALGESVHRLPRTLVASGNFVYIAATLAGIIVVDISDPTRPKAVGRFETSSQL